MEETSSQQQSNNKILVIDDESIIIESIQADLDNENYKIFSASNGKQGLEILKKERPILIILDIKMPGMDGIEFLEHIKLIYADPYSVIVLTGHGYDQEIQKCFNLGVSSFLSKPYNVHVLRGMVRHIIELKQTQQELRESEIKYRSLTQTATDAIIAANSKGEIVSWNSSAQKIFGHDEESILGKPVTSLMPERCRDSYGKNVEQSFLSEKSGNIGKTVELCGKKRGGNDFPLELSLGTWKTGDERFFSGIIRDISSAKHKDEHIRMLHRALEQSPGVVMITDTTGVIEYVNPKFAQLTGYSPVELTGKTPRVLKSGKQTDEVYKQLWTTVTSGKEWHGELQNMKKNGELYWESASISAVTNAAGEITHFIKVGEDITRLKQTESDLLNARDKLEETVEERTCELKSSLREKDALLTEREKLIGELTKALENVKTLKNLLPICCFCKKIRNDKGYWDEVETYLHEHSETDFTHTFCPECAKKNYPELNV